MKCIHIDGYVNTCVKQIMSTGPAKIGALTNYFIQKFQHLLKDHYVLHKKSVKILKNRKYKAYRGKHDEVPEYVLPEAYHVDHWEKVLKKAQKFEERLLGKKPDEAKFNKENMQVPGSQAH